MDTQTYSDLNSSLWNEINPRLCPCRGTGWLLSDWDSWHKCQAHHRPGSMNPEGEARLTEAQQCTSNRAQRAWALTMYRKAYATFRDIALHSGIESAKAFEALCRNEIRSTGKAQPSDWVDAAEKIAYQARNEHEDAQARKHGYSCALEARLSEPGSDY